MSPEICGNLQFISALHKASQHHCSIDWSPIGLYCGKLKIGSMLEMKNWSRETQRAVISTKLSFLYETSDVCETKSPMYERLVCAKTHH